MYKRKTIVETIEFICHAHKGQKDKQGKPYWHHPVAVADMVGRRGGSDDEIMAALLHDVVEDTDYTIDNLRKLSWTARTLRLVWIMTRRDTETHFEYIHRIADSQDQEAILLKLSDISHNADERRGPIPDGLLVRYNKSRGILYEGLRNLL